MKIINLYKYSIVISLMLGFMQMSCARRIANVYPLDKAYYKEAGLKADLKALSLANPESIKLHSIGVTANGNNPVYALQIQTDMDRIPILIIGQHHGDEVMGLEISMAFAQYLNGNSDDAKVRDLLDRYAFWIVPTLNPDAWKVVTAGKFEWKRKNNTDTNNNRKLDLKTDGVDLNRNYPTFWYLDKIQPVSSPFYKGTAPASEAEIKAITELAALVRFKYVFSYHTSASGSYSETIYLPWQDMKSKKTKADFAAMREIADTYAAAVPKDYKTGTYAVHPGNTSKIGNARNYFFYEWGAYSFDIEVCGSGSNGAGIVHPMAAKRDEIVKKNVQALINTIVISK